MYGLPNYSETLNPFNYRVYPESSLKPTTVLGQMESDGSVNYTILVPILAFTEGLEEGQDLKVAYRNPDGIVGSFSGKATKYLYMNSYVFVFEANIKSFDLVTSGTWQVFSPFNASRFIFSVLPGPEALDLTLLRVKEQATEADTCADCVKRILGVD